MDPIRIQPATPPGVAASVRAGLGAGAVCGLLFGLADAIVAANLDAVRGGALALAGCFAAAVLQYTVIGMAALAVLGVVLHPLLRKSMGSLRQLVLLRIGLALGLFAELAWWTRPYVFYGHAVASPERLVAMAAMLAVAATAAWFLAAAILHAPPAIQRTSALVAVALWVAGIAFLFAQRNAVGSRGEIGPANKELPNVVLVIVDAMRQDVLGCYGNTRVKTPHVDRLAAEGVVFEDAFTQAPFTWSSFGSILTGKYPRRHGLLHMKPGLRMPENETLPTILKSAVKSDGTQLTERDWLEATFHTGTLTAASGLLGGFDMRYEATAGHDLVVLASSWSVFRAGLLVSILRNKANQHLELGGTAAEATKWIDAHADRRFFAMVHLYSTHTPYDPPEEFRRQYCDPNYTGPIRSFWSDHRQLIESGKYQATLADREQIRNLYYAGVAQADAQIGWIVDALEKRGILDDTLVIVTADHGESLGEQELWEHDHMVQSNLRIPLVMRWPKRLQPKTRVAALVDEIDILPTVCDLLGIALPAADSERARIDGTSLLPLVRGEASAVREFSLAENASYTAAQDRRWKVVVPHAALLGAEAWNRALAGDPEPPRLYDLQSDPEERFNLLRKEPAEASRLFEKIRTFNDSLPIPPDSILESPRDIETQKQLLGKLGYTESDPPGPKK
ncbi:MAG TPA: sulfatase [Planctomycetota bacterium]|jgi:arylsulfatase A-like enzyme|nr:sulfatase [Planctomycetota bacterium]